MEYVKLKQYCDKYVLYRQKEGRKRSTNEEGPV
jgi:hypothetical protein